MHWTLMAWLLTAVLPSSSRAQDPSAPDSTTAEHPPGDGGPAAEAFLNFPEGVALDRAGHLYISERGGHRVRRVDARTGVITTVAGTGERGDSGDGGPATAARLDEPTALAVDARGDLLIGDTWNHRIRRVDGRTGTITTIVGTGIEGDSGDGGPAVQARISAPFGIALDARQNLYFADTENHRIRRVDARTGVISTVAGNGEWGRSGDGGPATRAALARPHRLLVDHAGDLIIADSFNQQIRRVDSATGIITTLAGTGRRGTGGDGGPPRGARFCFFGDIVEEPGGALLVSGVCDHRIRRVDLRRNRVSAFAGTGRWGFDGDGGPALRASFHLPAGMAFDAAGRLYVADAHNGRVRRIDRAGIVTTVAGCTSPRRPSITFHFHYDPERYRAPLATLVPGMDDVHVIGDVDYSSSGDPLRRMDVYRPRRTLVAPLPAVLLIHEGSDVEITPRRQGRFETWGRVLAASGFAAVTFDHRWGSGSLEEGAADVERATDHLRRHGAEWNVDPDRLCLFSFFDGAALVAPLLDRYHPSLRCLVAFYPLLDLRGEGLFLTRAPSLETRTRFSLLASIEAGTALPPTLIVRTGRDSGILNRTVDAFIAGALARNEPLELLALPEADTTFEHGDSPAARAAVARSIEFLRGHLLETPSAPAHARTPSHAGAARAAVAP